MRTAYGDDVSAGTAASLIETALAGEISHAPRDALRERTNSIDPSTANQPLGFAPATDTAFIEGRSRFIVAMVTAVFPVT